MLMLAPYLQLILYILLGTSAMTLVLVFWSVLHSKTLSAKIASLTKLVAAITSLGTLLVSLLNVSAPIGRIPPIDEAKQTIDRFYDAIQIRNFDAAFGLIHSARIAELPPTFRRDQFAETYASTREYRNMLISLKTASSDSLRRLYSVSFDVSDEVPTNRIYASRQILMKDLSVDGFLNRESLIGFVLENLREFYEVPKSAEPFIREYILNRQFESVFDPLFLSEICRNMNQNFQISLTPRPEKPTTMVIWRHFIQELQLAEDQGAWKIRQGLGQPIAKANYFSPAAP